MAYNTLIVDDSSVMRSMIIKTLRMSGVPLGDLHQAANGKEGLEALSQHWIDLVIVDINMPVMTGEEMIGRMREDPHLSSIPIIVVSTEGSEQRIERLKEQGVAFIHKPFAPETVRDTIKEIMEAGHGGRS
jgi:two-component system, chemotaxis family, chemotaxis protein CheY